MKCVKEKENLDKIWEKIRKIAALKQSATEIGEEGEAQAAAAAISCILLKYDLSLDDIPEKDKAKNKVCLRDIDFKISYDNLQWYTHLINVLCRENSCQHLLGWKYDQHKYVRYHKVVGREKNVEIVLYLISFLSNHFLSAARTRKKKVCSNQILFQQKSLSTQQYMKSFLLGCVFGLEQKIEIEKKDFSASAVTALSVRSTQEIEDFYEQEHMTIGTARKTTFKTLDVSSFIEGKEVGENTEINHGIENKSSFRQYIK